MSESEKLTTNKEINILLIGCPERYTLDQKKGPTTYPDIIKYYINHGKYKTTLLLGTCNFSEKKFDDMDPSIIIFLDIDTLRYAKNFKYVFKKPVWCVCEDFFYFKDCINCEYIQKCMGLITYPNQTKVINAYKRVFPNKKFLSFNGRFINSSIYKNYNNNKKYDILVYGMFYYENLIEEHDADKEYKLKYQEHNKTLLPNKYNFYPLRQRLRDLLLANKHKYNLKILNARGSLVLIAQGARLAEYFVNENLSNLINESWLTVCTRSRANILMDKYVESAGSYSGILGNIPHDYQSIFKDNIVEVSEWMTDDEILNTIDKALADKQKLQEMITSLGDKVHQEFSLQTSVKKFDAVFDEILNYQTIKS